MGQNIATILRDTAERHGDRVAQKLEETEVSYAQVEEGSARIARMLRAQGLDEGGRVAMMLPNVPHFAPIYYGVLRMGAVVVPINPRYEADEVAHHLEDSGSKLLFAWHDFRDAAERGAGEAGAQVISVEPERFIALLAEHEPDHEVVMRERDAPAVLLYTSGTTGRPKGAVLTQGNLEKSTDIITSLVEMSEDDVILAALPFFHVFGQGCGLNGATKLGACLSLIPKFDPTKVLEAIQRDGVTIFEGVPAMYGAVLNSETREQYDSSSLRVAIVGGQAMPVEVMRQFEEAFGIEVLEGYGLSETTAVATFNHPGEKKAGSTGTPVDGVEVRIVDDERGEVAQGDIGEIAVKGANVMARYWNKEEETNAALRDGWFHTGDLGHIDEEGYVFIDDRKKDMIIRGGENVYPREIEEVLYRHEAIQEVAVIGVKDERLGEEIGAAVVVRKGQDISAEEIQEYLKGKVAKYKYPRKIWFLDELPKGPTGKVLKREIETPQ